MIDGFCIGGEEPFYNDENIENDNNSNDLSVKDYERIITQRKGIRRLRQEIFN